MIYFNFIAFSGLPWGTFSLPLPLLRMVLKSINCMHFVLVSNTDIHSIHFGWEFNYAYVLMPSTTMLQYTIIIQANLTKIH